MTVSNILFALFNTISGTLPCCLPTRAVVTEVFRRRKNIYSFRPALISPAQNLPTEKDYLKKKSQEDYRKLKVIIELLRNEFRDLATSWHFAQLQKQKRTHHFKIYTEDHRDQFQKIKGHHNHNQVDVDQNPPCRSKLQQRMGFVELAFLV